MEFAPVTDVPAPPAGLSARSIHTSMRAYTPEMAGGMLSRRTVVLSLSRS